MKQLHEAREEDPPFNNLRLRNDGFRLGGGAAGQRGALLGETHLLGKSVVWDPFGGCAKGGLLQHFVDLLKGETLGLGDEEVREGEEDEAESAPEEEDFGAHIGIARGGSDRVWGDDSDDLLLFISIMGFNSD